jgi:hypothetical protein
MNDKIIFVVTALARLAGSDPWPAAQGRRFQRTVVCLHNPKVFSP